ncbi:hypothetical protein EG328_010779 [Venturia inaequalis]|uniref:Cyanovirin-N domain-containing protein n=1 Tax=Venturia inaequalis TaxID=5025 RepID=A0A8H3YN09_VENIN|nr:hypothetical protein EG328_010779 [Venturia inaequalis]RDI85216.1 hypothetical protein Vi05172_g4795 [Venturia inaequalis]
MLYSVVFSTLLAGFAAASVDCPIKPYDAAPGYQIACVYGDAKGVYENRLVKDIDVVGSTFSATLPFECIRQVGNADSPNGGAKWLGYNLNGKLCWVTEGNVQGEDKAECFKELEPCKLRGVNDNGMGADEQEDMGNDGVWQNARHV